MPLRFEQVDEDTFLEPFFGTTPIGRVDPEAYAEVCRQIETEPVHRTTQWQLVRRFLEWFRAPCCPRGASSAR